MEVAQNFIQYVLAQICQHTADIKVEPNEENNELVVAVHDDDMGRLIGKNGQLISALRVLTRSISSREERYISLKIIDKRND